MEVKKEESKYCVLIPAYNPESSLLEVVTALIDQGVSDIIVIDDGSKEECREIFQKLQTLDACHILYNAVNLGKGRALKTGLNYFYLKFPHYTGVVTADADGQHAPEDIIKVAQSLQENPNHLVMGTRQFKKDVPFRSLLGNVATKFVFSFMVGKRVSDTQSGLRGIPTSFVPHLLKIKGERYEYEINMLIASKVQAVPIKEEPIKTIYIEDNRSSHFNPLLDSMRIYFQLLRFAFSSLLASFFDFIVFTIAFRLSSNIFLSLIIGRFLVGSLLNYVINRRLVFHSKAGILKSLSKYYLALVVMSLFSWLLIRGVVAQLGLKVMFAKILVESLLFVLSFSIQREFVFIDRSPDNQEDNGVDDEEIE